jgi:hypothetical protein
MFYEFYPAGFEGSESHKQCDSVIDFDKAFGSVINPPSPGERIPDPLAMLSGEEWEKYQEELRVADQALALGRIAAGLPPYFYKG